MYSFSESQQIADSPPDSMTAMPSIIVIDRGIEREIPIRKRKTAMSIQRKFEPRAKPEIADLSTNSVWDEKRERLIDLYFKQELPERLVLEVMQYIHHAKPRYSNYIRKKFREEKMRKNHKGSGSKDTTTNRKRSRKGPSNPHGLRGIVLLDELICTSNVPSSFSPAQLRIQETVLISIDRYINTMFDPGSKKWSIGSFEFVPAKALESQSSKWVQLEGRSYSTSLLLQANHMRKAEDVLSSLFKDVEGAMSWNDPSFLAHFWQICLYFHGTRGRGLKYNILGIFLRKLAALTSRFNDERKSLSILLRALSQVHAVDFKETLRMGYFKTIETLGRFVEEHEHSSTILQMLSVYYQHWNTHHLEGHGLIEKANMLWEHALECSLEPKIIASYQVTHISHYIYRWKEMAEKMALELYRYTTQKLSVDTKDTGWNFTSKAFVFATKIQVSYCRQSDEFEVSKRQIIKGYLDRAIEILKTRDVDHRVRAAELSRKLFSSAKRYGMEDWAETEEKRYQSIMSTIFGDEGRGKAHDEQDEVESSPSNGARDKAPLLETRQERRQRRRQEKRVKNAEERKRKEKAVEGDVNEILYLRNNRKNMKKIYKITKEQKKERNRELHKYTFARQEKERKEAKAREEARQKNERLESEPLEAEQLDAEQLEAERLEAENVWSEFMVADY